MNPCEVTVHAQKKKKKKKKKRRKRRREETRNANGHIIYISNYFGTSMAEGIYPNCIELILGTKFVS